MNVLFNVVFYFNLEKNSHFNLGIMLVRRKVFVEKINITIKIITKLKSECSAIRILSHIIEYFVNLQTRKITRKKLIILFVRHESRINDSY